MSKVQQLIVTLSESDLQGSYVERINAIRSNVKEGNIPSCISMSLAAQDSFGEASETFDDSTDWSNNWDQGAPSK